MQELLEVYLCSLENQIFLLRNCTVLAGLSQDDADECIRLTRKTEALVEKIKIKNEIQNHSGEGTELSDALDAAAYLFREKHRRAPSGEKQWKRMAEVISSHIDKISKR